MTIKSKYLYILLYILLFSPTSRNINCITKRNKQLITFVISVMYFYMLNTRNNEYGIEMCIDYFCVYNFFFLVSFGFCCRLNDISEQ